MLAMHGRRSEVDIFAWHLARELGKTIGEIEAMPYAEYLGWSSYFTARAAIASVQTGKGGAIV
jgi:hypothetical protein